MKPHRIEKLYKGCILAAMVILLGMLAVLPAKAQRNGKAALTKMIEDDRSTIDAIAGCDGNVQNNILQLAQTPEVLDIVQDLQKKSEKRFRDIIVPYDRDGQAALYDMARYPDLITELVSHGKPSSSEVNRIVMKYPSEISETAKKYARSYYDALRQIDQLNTEIDRNFQSNLAPYDEQTRTSVNVLLKYPEIVSILVEDKDFTRQLGETYREDPQWVNNQLDIISAKLNEQSKNDVADYKRQLESDPEAYNEMVSAAERFASENNSTRAYDAYVDPEVDVRVVVNSYPYWFGYPYWYPYAYWRPYPAYYHTGFYFGPSRNIIFVGLPSSHFIYWQTHYHPTLYPHLSYSYYNYYNNHYQPYHNQWRRPVSHYGFYRSVEHYVINNPRVNNENLVKIDRRRGNNIVQKPNMSQSSEYGRRQSTYSQQGGTSQSPSTSNEGSGRRGSVKRDAFPRATPSVISPRNTDVYNHRNASGRYENTGTSRSGQNGTINERPQQPSSNAGVNQSTRTQSNGNGSINQQRQGRTQTNATPQTRNYRNYKASEPREANPSSTRRSAPANAAPSQRQQQSTPERAAPSQRQQQSAPERAAPSQRQQQSGPAARVDPSKRQQQSTPSAHAAPSQRREQSAPARGNQELISRSSGNSRHR